MMAAHVAWRSFGFPPSQTRPEGRRESEGLGGVGVAVAVAVVLAVRARALFSDWCGEGDYSKRSGLQWVAGIKKTVFAARRRF